jgi:hypothetical protein
MRDKTPGQTAWRLILSDKPRQIARLEKGYGRTQQEAVDDFIEDSCWSESVREFVGHKGTQGKRREALRSAYRKVNPEP